MGYKVAVIGATGNVGREMLNILAERSFPADERFGLTNQMRRSVVSVSSNIAEGSSRSSKTDFGRFVEIGTGSVFELVSQSFVARRQNFLSEKNFHTIYGSAAEIGRMLSGLRTSLEQR